MTVPNVRYRVLNGRLGVRRPGGVELHAVVGSCSSGDADNPTRHSRSEDLLTKYTSGPAPELALRAMENFGAEALMVRTEEAASSSFGTLDDSGVSGSSTVTRDGASESDDDYEPYVKVVTGGTVGSAGITYQTSLDAGRTLSPIRQLGTQTSITIPGSGGIVYNLSGGTLETGDSWSDLAKAPKWDTSALAAALDTLKTTQHRWKAVWIAGAMDASEAAVVQQFLASLETNLGRCRKAYIELRMPDLDEGEDDYLDAMSSDFASFVEKKITACYAAARVLSARTGRPYLLRRNPIHAISGLPQSLQLKIDMAQTVDAGALPGVFLYDAAGNLVEHDEMHNPGADDARFLALRSWPDKEGVYVNNPTTLEGSGLDFHLDQFVRILCVFCDTARSVLVDELSRDLDLNLKTRGPNVAGAPTEAECQRIDERVRKAVKAELSGQVSDAVFKLHRDNLVLETQTLSGDGGFVFKGYPKFIEFTVAAINPAAGA